MSFDKGNTHQIIQIRDLFKKLGLIFNASEVPEFDGNILNKVWINKTVEQAVHVLTVSGWTKIHELNVTKKMHTLTILTEDGNHVTGADHHLLMTDNGWKCMDEITSEDSLLNGAGFVRVCSNTYNDYQSQELYDVSTDAGDFFSVGHFLGNDIDKFVDNAFLSHNTITAAITILHYCLFNDNKGCMIVANKNDTVIEIIDKIKNIYKLLPFFLQAGVINWNNKSISFDNSCRIKSQARSKEPAIGFTIDLLYMDEFAHIPSTIARSYYKAAVPTVSSIKNSKIIITSTPNGANLFKELVMGAQHPVGHPDKNPYTFIKVLWWQVPGRLDPKAYPLVGEMYKRGITIEQLFKDLTDQGIECQLDEEVTDLGPREFIRIKYQKDIVDTNSVRYMKVLNDLGLSQLCEVTDWKEQETKLIGGPDNFNQEYDLQFVSGAKRILNTKTCSRLDARRAEYVPVAGQIEALDKRLSFPVNELVFHPEFEVSARNNYYWFTSVDISEGLGQDSSVIDMYRLLPRPDEWLKDNKIKTVQDAFYLKQTAIYAFNRLHPREFAELFYLLHFEWLDPQRVKSVVEVNGKAGGDFLGSLPGVFESNNQYGSYVFARFKHNKDDKYNKVGIRVNSNKKDMMKDYIDAVESDKIFIDEDCSLNQMDNFIKVETRSGSYTYRADSGHDDYVMPKVNLAASLNNPEFKNRCMELYEELPVGKRDLIDRAMDLQRNPQALSYKGMSNALKSVKTQRRFGTNRRK